MRRLPGGRPPVSAFITSIFYAPFLYAEMDRVPLSEAKKGAFSEVLGQSFLNYSSIANLLSIQIPERFFLRVAGARSKAGAGQDLTIKVNRGYLHILYNSLFHPESEEQGRGAQLVKRLALEERWQELADTLFINFGSLYESLPVIRSLYADAATIAAAIELYLRAHIDAFTDNENTVTMVRNGQMAPILRIAKHTAVHPSLALAAWIALFGRKDSAAALKIMVESSGQNWTGLEAILWSPIDSDYTKLDAFIDMQEVIAGKRSIKPGPGRIPTRRNRATVDPKPSTDSQQPEVQSAIEPLPSADSQPTEPSATRPPSAPTNPTPAPREPVVTPTRQSSVSSLKQQERGLFKS